jgi:hypothetical protein
MSWFETLYNTFFRPDREEHPERAEVARAANFLQIGEFQLLQLAYCDWHGEEMPRSLLDTIFFTYMVEDRVPHWARHYARRILQAAELGGVDDQDPRYHRYDDDYGTELPQGVRRFIVAATLVVGVVGGGVITSHYLTEPTSSILPPYFEDEPAPEADIEPMQKDLRGS